MQKVHLKRTKRLLAGHLWVFSNEIYESVKKYTPGAIVEVLDMHENFIGIGYINPHSLISIRLLTRKRESIDREFFKRRINEALKFRERIVSESNAYRIVYSEADYLPGLIADRYGSCLVLQFLTLGIETFRDIIIDIMNELLTPEIIVLKNEARSRMLEGIPLYKEIIIGKIEKRPVVSEDGIFFEVDVYEGQKTGFFLDQRGNRIALKRYVKKGRGLDLFCYAGAWAMHLASVGNYVTCVDSSERAIVQAAKNAEINKLQENINYVKEDVFTYLEREITSGDRRYDFIVLDPPAFVKSAGKLKEAVKAYQQINSICMRLLKRGGILATSSCSYHLGREMFLDMLQSAGRSAKRELRLIELRSQGPDHPVMLSMPETEYLKCAFLVVD